MLRQSISFIFAFFLTPLFLNAQCLAKCWIPFQYNHFKGSYAVYSGEYIDTLTYLKRIKLILHPANFEWVYRPLDPNCIDPENCIVWLQVQIPEDFVELSIVTDTFQIDNFFYKTFEIKELIGDGGYYESLEILCPEDVTSDFLEELSVKLMELGFLSPNQLHFREDILKGLLAFQKKYELPLGYFNLESLDYIGIDIN